MCLRKISPFPAQNRVKDREMSWLERIAISFCMGWIIADANYFGFAFIGLCWIGIELCEKRYSKAPDTHKEGERG